MYTCIDGAHSHNDIGIENTTTIDNESSRQRKSERESAKEKGSAKRERRSTVRKGERQINLYTHTWSRTKSLYFIFGTFYSFKWSKQRNTRKKNGQKIFDSLPVVLFPLLWFENREAVRLGINYLLHVP